MVWKGEKLVPPPTSLARPCAKGHARGAREVEEAAAQEQVAGRAHGGGAAGARISARSASSKWMQCAYTARSRIRPWSS
jgi:hypothetical protein